MKLYYFHALKGLWGGQGKIKMYYGVSRVKKQLSGKGLLTHSKIVMWSNFQVCDDWFGGVMFMFTAKFNAFSLRFYYSSLLWSLWTFLFLWYVLTNRSENQVTIIQPMFGHCWNCWLLRYLGQTISLQMFKSLSSTNFNWSILEYLDPYMPSTLQLQKSATRNLNNFKLIKMY